MRLIPRSNGPGKGRMEDPVDPNYLRVAGLISTDTAKRPPPVAVGEGVQEYRLYANYGIWGREDQTGRLRLEARPGSEEGSEEILFRQVSVDGGSGKRSGSFGPNQGVFRLEGRVRCRGGHPVEWSLASALFDYSDDPDGPMVEETFASEETVVRNGDLRVKTAGGNFVRPLPPGAILSEWDLLRLVPRLPFEEPDGKSFCLLEGLTVPKSNAFLAATGRHSAPDFGGDLLSFSLLARGIVPYDYWLDTDHRLIGCMSGGLGRAWIPETLVIPPLYAFAETEYRKERWP